LARECRNPARYQIGGECGISGACCRAAAQAMAQAATAALFTIIALVDIEESFRSVPFRSGPSATLHHGALVGART